MLKQKKPHAWFGSLCLILLWLQVSCGRDRDRKNDDLPLREGAPEEATPSESAPKVPPLLTRSTISRDEMLQQLGNAFGDEVRLLRQALYNLSGALANACSTGEIYDQRVAQQQWAAAMLVWQRLELLKVGPLVDKKGMLRREFYNWPEPVATCAIDQHVVDIAQYPRRFALPRNKERRGLGSLEYLLFEEKLQPSCRLPPARAQIWRRLSESQKKGARCAYAQALVSDLIQKTESLLGVWGPSDRHAFMASPEANAERLQTLFENIFLLDQPIRSLKLQAPAGLNQQRCRLAPEPCPDQEEFVRSQLSADAIKANVYGFRTLMLGPLVGRRYAGGFTALLRAAGGGEAADKLEDRVIALTQLAEGTDKTLRELIADHYAEPCEVRNYDSWICKMDRDIGEMTQIVAEEMAPLLGLRVPAAPPSSTSMRP